MSRQSLRKVKLTSKFEEFSTSRLASIQRLAHPDNNQTSQQQQQDTSMEAQPSKTEKAERATPKVEREPPKIVDTPKQAPETPVNNVVHKERTPHKALRQKAVTPSAPVTPAFESNSPSPYSHLTPMPKLTANGKIRGRPRKIWQQKAETVVKPISSAREELLRLREENVSLKTQIDQVKNDFEELKRQSSYTGQTVPKVDYDDLKEKYQKDLTHAKRHEWCVVCLNPSRYYCCWNTTYCSQKCQVLDWYQRHLKSCARLRAAKTKMIS